MNKLSFFLRIVVLVFIARAGASAGWVFDIEDGDYLVVHTPEETRQLNDRMPYFHSQGELNPLLAEMLGKVQYGKLVKAGIKAINLLQWAQVKESLAYAASQGDPGCYVVKNPVKAFGIVLIGSKVVTALDQNGVAIFGLSAYEDFASWVAPNKRWNTIKGNNGRKLWLQYYKSNSSLYQYVRGTTAQLPDKSKTVFRAAISAEEIADPGGASADLLHKYAPIIYLYPGEQHTPGNARNFVYGSKLGWTGYPTEWPTLVGLRDHVYEHKKLDDGHGVGYSFSSDKNTRPHDSTKWLGGQGFFLDLDDNYRNGSGTKAPVYFQRHKLGKNREAIAYWFFYPYNDSPPANPDLIDTLFAALAPGVSKLALAIPQIREEVQRLIGPQIAGYVDDHEGDWEHVSILFVNNEPKSIAYYRHKAKDTQTVDWDYMKAHGHLEGTHPVVFSAIGSHGSYPLPQNDSGRGFSLKKKIGGFTVKGITFPSVELTISYDNTGKGARWAPHSTLDPAGYHLINIEHEPWRNFGGAWGNVGSTRDNTGPKGPFAPQYRGWDDVFPLRLPAWKRELAIAGAASITEEPKGYTIVDIGTLGGQGSAGIYETSASAINNAGQICGASLTPSGFVHAFIYSSGVMTDLGTLGGRRSMAYDLNSEGRVVGWAEKDDYHLLPVTFYDQSVYNTRPVGSAVDINNSDEIVGSGATSHALLDTASGYQTLWMPNERSSNASAINNQGEVTGIYRLDDYINHAFLYSNGVMTNLGTLGGAESVAIDINDKGTIIGSSKTASNVDHGFAYAHGVMTDLGEFFPSCINNQDEMVGSATFDGIEHPALYKKGQFTDLTTLLSPDSGWTLYSAEGINDLGQIVGNGLHNGRLRSFLLSPKRD